MENEYNMSAAEEWLKTAELSTKNGIPQTALYAMEMALEIAMKSVLERIGVDVPKTHYIGNIFLKEVRSQVVPAELKKESSDLVDTFSELLRLRPLSGYGLKSLSKEEAAGLAEKYLPKVGHYVELCREYT